VRTRTTHAELYREGATARVRPLAAHPAACSAHAPAASRRHGQLVRAVGYPQCDDADKPDVACHAWDMLLKVDYTQQMTPIVVGCRPLEAAGPYRDALRRVFNTDTDDSTLMALLEGRPLEGMPLAAARTSATASASQPRGHAAAGADAPPTEGRCCEHCGRCAPRLMRCGRCRRSFYCDTTCQAAEWKTHKATCTRA
jgi:hypothetical protein